MSEQILQNAWRLHQSGNLPEAARLYQQVLQANPRDFNALQMMGFLHFQRSEFGEAERLMERALQIQPKSVDALYNRGCALQALGRLQEAIACFDRTLALKPDHPPAHMNRGNALSQLGRFEDALVSYDLVSALLPNAFEALLNRGNVLFELKRYADALASFDAALKLQPQHPTIWNNRGNALSELGRHAEAVESFGRAVALHDAYPDALAGRATALTQLNRHEDALADFERALAADPGHPDLLYGRANSLVHLNRQTEALAAFEAVLAADPGHASAMIGRGAAAMALKRYDIALQSIESAIAADPRNADALSNRASLLSRMRRYEEALASAGAALEADPRHAPAWHNRGTALDGLKRHREALESYDRALALMPENATSWNNRGGALLALRRYDEALSHFDRATGLDPSKADAHANRAITLSMLKRYPDSIAAGDTALRLEPNHAGALRARTRSKLHACDWSTRRDDMQAIGAGLAANRLAVAPFDHRALSDSEGEHLQSARLLVAEECPPEPAPLWRGERYGHEKIRLAYISTDFRAHAVASLIAGVFEHHDRSRFETIAISIGPEEQSELRERIIAAFDGFSDASDQSDGEIAAMMREMEIDIAVDLNGFTGDYRTGILAHRPAPVQVNFLGYPGTMAAPYIDYLIADRTVIPNEHRRQYSEQIVTLPDTYQPNDRTRRAAVQTPTRAEAGLPEQGFVFCCFNNTFKIGPDVFDVWMRLLTRVPGSVLWLLDDNAAATASLRREAEARGVSADRLVFAPRVLSPEHLARHALADLFLDTWPYNAHTTASDAVWMGLPLVSLSGMSFQSRVAGSVLHAAGLGAYVTQSVASYEELAAKLATDPRALAEAKAAFAAARASSLFDIARFTRHLESAFHAMWMRHEAGEHPLGFAVSGTHE